MVEREFAAVYTVGYSVYSEIASVGGLFCMRMIKFMYRKEKYNETND